MYHAANKSNMGGNSRKSSGAANAMPVAGYPTFLMPNMPSATTKANSLNSSSGLSSNPYSPMAFLNDGNGSLGTFTPMLSTAKGMPPVVMGVAGGNNADCHFSSSQRQYQQPQQQQLPPLLYFVSGSNGPDHHINAIHISADGAQMSPSDAAIQHAAQRVQKVQQPQQMDATNLLLLQSLPPHIIQQLLFLQQAQQPQQQPQQQPLLYFVSGSNGPDRNIDPGCTGADRTQMSPLDAAIQQICEQIQKVQQQQQQFRTDLFTSAGSNRVFVNPTGFLTPRMPFSTTATTSTSATSVMSNPTTTTNAANTTAANAAHHVNGMQYSPAATYEGFVKRYNPVRGFGFLTATHQIIKTDTTNTNADDDSVVVTAGTISSWGGKQPSSEGYTSMTSGSSAGETDAQTSSLYRSTTDSSSDILKGEETRLAINVGDIFVHQSYVHMRGFRSLPVGGRVRFGVGFLKGQESFQAVDVELLPQVLPPSFRTGDGERRAAAGTQGAANTVASHTNRVSDGTHVNMGTGDCNCVASGAMKSAGVRRPQTGEMEDTDEDTPLIELAADVFSRLQSTYEDM